MTSAASVQWQRQRSLAETLPAPSTLLFGAVVAWDILHVASLEVAGSTFAPETIALGALTAYALMRAALHRTSRELAAQRVLPLAKVFAVFWGCIALVWLVHGADAESAGTFVRLPVFAMYAASTALICQRRQDVLIAARAVVLAAAVLCVATVLQGLPASDVQGGTFRWGYINPLAHAVGLGVCIGYGLLATEQRRSWLRWSWLLAMACVPIYARSRGAMVAAAAGCIAVWWHCSRPQQRALWAVTYAAVATSGIALIASGMVEDLLAASGLFEQFGSSNYFRWQIVVLGARMFLADPLAGGGLGAMAHPTPDVLDGLASLPRHAIVTGDNDYARFAAECGLLGLGAIAFLALRFLRQRRIALSAAGTRAPTLPVLGSSILAFLFVLAAFENVFLDPTGWLLLGLAWACFAVK